MPDTDNAGELEAGLDAIDTLGRVVGAVNRADESITLLASVQIANTQGARQALQAARLTVLDRLLDDVRHAVGVPAPVAPGQLTLEGGADA